MCLVWVRQTHMYEFQVPSLVSPYAKIWGVDCVCDCVLILQEQRFHRFLFSLSNDLTWPHNKKPVGSSQGAELRCFAREKRNKKKEVQMQISRFPQQQYHPCQPCLSHVISHPYLQCGKAHRNLLLLNISWTSPVKEHSWLPYLAYVLKICKWFWFQFLVSQVRSSELWQIWKIF